MKTTSHISILGVRIDNVTFEETLVYALKCLKGKSSNYFTTPNPEITLLAQKNPAYQKILNASALNTPDGTGLIYASKLLKLFGKSKIFLRERVTGTDLTIELIKRSKTYGYKIFFFGASKESNAKTQEFARRYGAHIAGDYSGGDMEDEKLITRINQSKADLVLVALGAPKQELWISKHLKECPHVKLMIGIGGAFDFIAEARVRAPSPLRRLGFEWLYRLIQEPRRIKRIANAVFVFPMKVFLSAISDI